MVPLEKLRELIPDSDKYSDEELTKIRTDMEVFADIAFDLWLAERNKRYTGFMTEAQREVLSFLVQTLKSEDIEFQASGGLAAIAYGGTRPLYDIDLEIYRKDAEKVGTLFKDYITEDWNNDLEGPEDEFDLWILKLNIRGVPIDINQVEDSRIKSKEGEWIVQPDTLEYEMQTVEGIELPVQSKSSLVAYKKLIARDTDLIDIEQITNV